MFSHAKFSVNYRSTVINVTLAIHTMIVKLDCASSEIRMHTLQIRQLVPTCLHVYGSPLINSFFVLAYKECLILSLGFS